MISKKIHQCAVSEKIHFVSDFEVVLSINLHFNYDEWLCDHDRAKFRSLHNFHFEKKFWKIKMVWKEEKLMRDNKNSDDFMKFHSILWITTILKLRFKVQESKTINSSKFKLQRIGAKFPNENASISKRAHWLIFL